MNGSNIGAGFGGGIAAGYIIGSSLGRAAGEEDERKRGKRLANRGKDQILLKVKAPVEKVGKTVAELFTNWKFEDGDILGFHPFSFDWGTAVLTWIIGGVVILFGSLIFMHDGFPFGLFAWVGSAIVIGIALGGLGGLEGWSKIDYIKIGEVRDYSTVLVKIYDDDGNRNIDDDDILRLVENLEDLYDQEREVSDSLKTS